MNRKSRKALALLRSVPGAEGSYRGPAMGIGELGGIYPIPFGDGYQRNLEMGRMDSRLIPAVYAAVMASARAVSQCYAVHKRIDPKTKMHEVVTTSPASRVLRRPNSYQTWSQFILNMVATMQFEGESFAYATRDDRFAINAVHPLPARSTGPYIVPETYDLFYAVGATDLFYTEPGMMIPGRNILHLRQHTPRHPLIGESAIKAAALAAGVNVALSRSQEIFFNRMNRPSGILSSDQFLTKVQMERLRSAFDEQSKGWAQGNMPILGGGLKFTPMQITSQDSQLIQAQRLSIEDLARVFGTPLPIVGDLSASTFSNVENLINLWLSLALGALLENLEQSLIRLFDLPADEYIELDTTALLRTDFKGRIDALTSAVSKGLYTPNEGRARENLPPVDHGDVPYMQQQMVPLGTVIGGQNPDEPAPKDEPAEEEETEEEIETPPETADKQLTLEEVALLLKSYNMEAA